MSAGKSPLRALAGATAVLGALVMAPAALAAGVSYTWTGTGPTQNWSDAGNWTASDSSLTAPSGTVGTLTFPALTCGVSATPCSGFDDVSSLAADELVIDTSTSYSQYESGAYGNEPVTVGGNGRSPNVGLTTTYGNAGAAGSNPTAVFDLPILLAGPAQEWDIPRGNLYITQISDAPGQNTPLTVNLGGGPNYGYLETGQINTSGSLTVQGYGDLGLAYGSGLKSASLPSMTLTGTTDVTVATTATSGPIDASADHGDVQVYGQPGSTLSLPSGNLTLGPTSGIDLDVDGTSASLSNSIKVVAGSAVLGGARLSLYQNAQTPYQSCNNLLPGATVTLLSAAGGISGPLAVAGQTITSGQSATEPITNECGGSSATAIINYNANSITATIAGAPSIVGPGPHISGRATVGDKLTSTTGTWAGGPAPTYSYQWLADGSAISGANGSSYTLTGAEVGKTITVAVTATNTYGHATAVSNGIGPVKAQASKVTPAMVRAALAGLGHPSGRHAINQLLKLGLFRTSFRAPASGTLRVVWTAIMTTGKGKHAKQHSYTVASGTVHAGGPKAVTVTIRLTSTGRHLLRAHLWSLHTTASERFLAAGMSWITMTRRFTL